MPARPVADALLPATLTLLTRRPGGGGGGDDFAVGSEDAVPCHVEARQPAGQTGAHVVRDGAQGPGHARHAVGRAQVVHVDVEGRVDSRARLDLDGDGVHGHSAHHRLFFTCSWQQ